MRHVLATAADRYAFHHHTNRRKLVPLTLPWSGGSAPRPTPNRSRYPSLKNGIESPPPWPRRRIWATESPCDPFIPPRGPYISSGTVSRHAICEIQGNKIHKVAPPLAGQGERGLRPADGAPGFHIQHRMRFCLFPARGWISIDSEASAKLGSATSRGE